MDDPWWDTGYISGIGPEQAWPGPVQILSLRACIWAMYRPGIGPYMAILAIPAIRPIWARLHMRVQAMYAVQACIHVYTGMYTCIQAYTVYAVYGLCTVYAVYGI